MLTTQIGEGVHWVGYVDWNIRDFHSYDTHQGTTYNAYLILDQRPALIDTVKAPYAAQLLRAVGSLIDPAQVQYIVCNHAELDHSGALPELLRQMPDATVLCNKKCAAALAGHFDTGRWKIQLVGTGEQVSLGRRTLRFIDTPMVHWPESMFTYVPEEELLLSMDAFGQHYATSERFDDQLPLDILLYEAKAYYANIIMPYGSAVGKALDALAALSVRTIAPSHGVVWRSHVDKILAAYRQWAVCRPAAKVLVLYDTMWESTAAMAEAIAQGASQPGVSVQLIHVRRTSLTRLATEVLDAACLALGSPALHREMMPAMAAALAYLQALRPPDRTALAFGSYGWGKGGADTIHQWIATMPWQVLREPIRCQYRPGKDTLEECRAAGRLLAEQALAAAAR